MQMAVSEMEPVARSGRKTQQFRMIIRTRHNINSALALFLPADPPRRYRDTNCELCVAGSDEHRSLRAGYIIAK